jgi:hypothetical protein
MLRFNSFCLTHACTTPPTFPRGRRNLNVIVTTNWHSFSGIEAKQTRGGGAPVPVSSG